MPTFIYILEVTAILKRRQMLLKTNSRNHILKTGELLFVRVMNSLRDLRWSFRYDRRLECGHLVRNLTFTLVTAFLMNWVTTDEYKVVDVSPSKKAIKLISVAFNHPIWLSADMVKRLFVDWVSRG